MNKTESYSEFVADFYNSRFDPRKDNFQNCGWGSVKSQTTRFEQLFRETDFDGKRILDFGCGTGDLVSYLCRQKTDFSYLGVDVSNNLLEQATKQFKNKSHVQFCLGDFDDRKKEILEFAPDISVASGVFTLKRPSKDNIEYAKSLLTRLVELSNEMVAVNFMSTKVDFTNPKNFHFDPDKMVEFSTSLSDQVSIFEDYGLWEFTIHIHKIDEN